ncbi:hypothetical protein ACFLVX_01550 [Chloroflexota bacterium]
MNKEQGNNESQPSTPEEIKPSGKDQANQPSSPAPEDASPSEDKKRKISGARIIRNLIADSVNTPEWVKKNGG